MHIPKRANILSALTLITTVALFLLPCEVFAPANSFALATLADTTAATQFYLLPISGMADEGTFSLYVNEAPLVTNKFQWKGDGSYSGDYVLSMAGQNVKFSLSIEVDAQGLWTKMRMESPQGPTDVVREGSVVTITAKKQTATVDLKPGTVIFENFDPALMSLAVRAYDQAKGGKQTFPIFIIPAAAMEASLERHETSERAIAGQDVRLTRYTYGLPGVNVIIYVDDKGRVVFGDVPAQHAAYVREGYDVLLKPVAEDSLISRPEYEVLIERDVQVPMRDRLKLATDIYRPKADGQFPVILVRTPYEKKMNEIQANFFARRGYVYAVQDCRGRFSSPGTWEPFVNEAKDGYDAVEWLAVQKWSTGKVGMIGGSYVGWVQWWAARDHPPHLVTIIPNVSPPDPYFNIPYEYGVFFLTGAIWWADVLESRATADLSGAGMSQIADKKYTLLLRHLPVVDLDEKILGKVNPYWRKWIAHPDNDSYWEPANFLEHLKNLNIPVFHQSGWFDGDGIGAKLNYLKMASYGHRYQKLVIGPWGHTDTATRRIGERDFGEAAIVDLQRDYLRWLDHWLKGVDNGIDGEPMVMVFAMGSNKWLTGDAYPLPETQMTKYYLTSGGHANTSRGDGKLTTELPTADVSPDILTYDPGDPTPSPYYYVKPEDLLEKEDTSRVYSLEEERRKHKEYYGKVDEERSDILVYDTPPLQDSLTFVGPISAVLYASSSAKDTDWFMRLSEVDAKGQVFPLTEGKIRARYRESFKKPALLEPGEAYEYHIDMWQTGITVTPGSRVRVEVASASFPIFSRNLNTGGHNETETKYVAAKQTIYHDASHPSYVLLPVIPAS